MRTPEDNTSIDFYKIYQDALEEYKQNVGHSIDDGDYPNYILYAMYKVHYMTINNKPMPQK